MIEATERRPDASAASLFPEAAAANKAIFYRNGRAASVSEVYASLTRTGGATPAVRENAPAAPELAPPLPPPSDFVLAQRMERLKRDRAVLEMVLGDAEPSTVGSLFSAQLLGAFGVEEETA